MYFEAMVAPSLKLRVRRLHRLLQLPCESARRSKVVRLEALHRSCGHDELRPVDYFGKWQIRLASPSLHRARKLLRVAQVHGDASTGKRFE
eukprot:Transcript_27078.p6 GENE.Transcript_27078~~Transcript_27078.p6  ORF type:complete len:91 (+),score=5.25 Transcript_27078:866-1138(+)